MIIKESLDVVIRKNLVVMSNIYQGVINPDDRVRGTTASVYEFKRRSKNYPDLWPINKWPDLKGIDDVTEQDKLIKEAVEASGMSELLELIQQVNALEKRLPKAIKDFYENELKLVDADAYDPNSCWRTYDPKAIRELKETAGNVLEELRRNILEVKTRINDIIREHN